MIGTSGVLRCQMIGYTFDKVLPPVQEGHFRPKTSDKVVTAKKTTNQKGRKPYMKTIRQRAFFRQRVFKEVAKGKQITETAIKYQISRTSIYRWQKRYDGTVDFWNPCLFFTSFCYTSLYNLQGTSGVFYLRAMCPNLFCPRNQHLTHP